jgi:hypothetical protein
MQEDNTLNLIGMLTGQNRKQPATAAIFRPITPLWEVEFLSDPCHARAANIIFLFRDFSSPPRDNVVAIDRQSDYR